MLYATCFILPVGTLKVVRGTLLHVSFACDHSLLMGGDKGGHGEEGNTSTRSAHADERIESCRSEEVINTEYNRQSLDESHRNDHRGSDRDIGKDSPRYNGRSSEMPTGVDSESDDDSYDDIDGVSDRARDELMRDLISISRHSVPSRTVLQRESQGMRRHAHTDRDRDRGRTGSKDVNTPSHLKCDQDSKNLKKQKLLFVQPKEPLVCSAVEGEGDREGERRSEEGCLVRVEYKEARFVIGQKR